MAAEHNLLSASEAARWIREGRISSEQLTRACLERIEEADGAVQAWAFLDRQYALAQARAADEWRLGGHPIGALHGVPVAIKDIFDTADMPTEYGSVLHAGRIPNHDSAVVAKLRAAGAVVLGKTVTTEFAAFAPGKTQNPHAQGHTPGGSSSGSAAAVAANMVPLAVGSQTNGSTIRPAAFCGVLGFKPTYGLISRAGMLSLASSLDQVGLFARSIEDLALMLSELAGHDAADPATQPLARQPFVHIAGSEPPLTPRLAFIKTPHFARADSDLHAAFADLVRELGDGVEEVELVPSAADAWQWHQTIMEAEMAASLALEWDRGKERLSDQLRAQLERGTGVSAFDYQRALARIKPVYQSLAELFEQRYDAFLTPSALGAAPRGLSTTGDPVFCTPWALFGMPAINLPLFEDGHGLPLGVQLVGARGADARLLRTGRWLAARLGS